MIGPYPHAELERIVRDHFQPSAREWRARELTARARHLGGRAKAPLRAAAERMLGGRAPR